MPPRGKRANKSKVNGNVEAEEDSISAAQVAAMTNQQKIMFTALVCQQYESYQGFVKLIMETDNKRFDDLNKEMQEIKTSLQSTQRDVDAIKATVGVQEKIDEDTRRDIDKTRESLITIACKMEQLEAQSKQKNLIFEGIKESAGESWTEAERKVKEILKDKLQIHQEIEMERVYRVGKRSDRGPRGMMVKLKNEKEKTNILQQAKEPKGTKI